MIETGVNRPADLALEQERLDALIQLQILDTLPEQAYDDIVGLASCLCSTPIALVSLIDVDRQWFKACFGMVGGQTPREHSFCAHAIKSPDEIFEISDALLDARFRDNPLVTGEPHIRFYAGAPIVLQNGQAMGALCVIDRTPRILSAVQRSHLKALARQTAALLDARLHSQLLSLKQTELEELSALAANERKRSAEILDVVLRAGDFGLWDLHIPTDTWTINQREREIFGYSADEATPSTLDWAALIHPDDRNALDMAMQQHLRGRTSSYRAELRMRHKDGGWLWILSRAMVVEKDDKRQPLRIVGTHLDITQRKEIEAELSRTSELLSRTNEMAQVGGWELDMKTQRLIWSDEVYRIHDLNPLYEPSVANGLEFYPPEARPVIAAAMKAAVEHGHSWDLELPFVTAAGRKLWVRAQGAPSQEDGRTVRLSGAFQDITVRKQAEIELLRKNEQLALLSVTDELTGLSNRRAIDRALSREWPRHARSGEPLALLLLDIDHFKKYNDQYGHLAGDDCLKLVANALANVGQEVDALVARYGGEEFAILLPNTSLPEAEKLAEACVNRVRQANVDTHKSAAGSRLSISAGVAVMKAGHGLTSAALIKAADDALYRAKHAGRARYST